ncbi:MAG: hypothetical protein ABI680_13380 [Chthoniobacteraceae bacterium]
MTRLHASALAVLVLIMVNSFAADSPRPVMKDFMGLCGHTVQFKPALYAPVTRLVRDYHPLTWDLGSDTSSQLTFPMAQNGVNWAQVYGSWRKEGLRPHACVIFDDLKPDAWHDLSKDAFAYGRAFASAFGPSAEEPLLEAVEIGNEPGRYPDETYRQLFEAMARGVRDGDPNMRIATCAANLGTSGRYSKSMDLFRGLESLFDIINIHLYAEIEGWPTWRRSYPEDPATRFVEHLRSVLSWRREQAPDKEVWLTEFGWDASTQPAPQTGDFAKWEGSTETQQAQWIVRAYLLLAREGVDRAYLYFFNDDDTPHVHGSSGLTRNFEPKPSYYAAAWLQKNLGEFRFSRVISEEPEKGYAYEFVHGEKPGRRIIAAWKPDGKITELKVPVENATVTDAERMPLSADPPTKSEVRIEDHLMTIEIGPSPVLVMLN